MTPHLVLGGPGTGKTTRLLDIVEEHLQRGIPPERIAYVSFTRKAATEAKARAGTRLGIRQKDMPWFRTIHSLCFQCNGTAKDDLLSNTDYKRIAHLLGIRFTGYCDVTEGISRTRGDAMMQVMSLAAARCVPWDEVWSAYADDIPRHLMDLYVRTVERYKLDTGKVDFADLLTRYDGSLDVDVAVVDEAQDLSTAQWSVVWKAFGNVKHLYFGGDDDQAIYHWAGADVQQFLGLKGHKEVLPVSHRLPPPVFDVAQQLAGRIQHRYQKQWRSAGHDGSVNWAYDLGHIDLDAPGSWMLLARNGYQLSAYKEHCRRKGIGYVDKKGSSLHEDHVRAIVYWERWRKGQRLDHTQVVHLAKFIRRWKGKVDPGSYTMADFGLQEAQVWHDALDNITIEDREYYLGVLRKGRRLQDKPDVYIGTIHSTKGGEADNVVLMTDMSQRSHEGLQRAADGEHRVFYVGATRARRALHVLAPTGDCSYPLHAPRAASRRPEQGKR